MSVNQHKAMAMGKECCKMKSGGVVKKVKDTDKDKMKCGGPVAPKMKKGGKC